MTKKKCHETIYLYRMQLKYFALIIIFILNFLGLNEDKYCITNREMR